jgi:hypothetical protein
MSNQTGKMPWEGIIDCSKYSVSKMKITVTEYEIK